MRIPSIHILKSDLEVLIGKYGGITLDNLDKVLRDARKVSAEHRSVHTTSQKASQNILKRTSSNIGDANLLADVIYSVRIKLKHLGVTKIKQSDNQWGNIKELSSIINEFCESQKLETREGYIKFVTIGISLITKQNKPNFNFLAKWLIQKASWIISEYQAGLQLGDDQNAKGTMEIHDIYVNEVLSRTGILTTYHRDTTQMLNFMKARDIADELGVPYENFVESQFYALAFCNGVPRVQDLCGDKAKERVVRWLSENNMVVDRNDNQASRAKVDWSKFRK